MSNYRQIPRYKTQDTNKFHIPNNTLQTSSNFQMTKYFPFGGCWQSQGTLPPQQFTGQRNDYSTGLYYYNARYYDPNIGRFISADTIIPDPSNPQSFNRYSYCLNNPLKYIDPTGRDVEVLGYDVSNIDNWTEHDWWNAMYYFTSIEGGLEAFYAFFELHRTMPQLTTPIMKDDSVTYDIVIQNGLGGCFTPKSENTIKITDLIIKDHDQLVEKLGHEFFHATCDLAGFQNDSRLEEACAISIENQIKYKLTGSYSNADPLGDFNPWSSCEEVNAILIYSFIDTCYEVLQRYPQDGPVNYMWALYVSRFMQPW